MDELHGELPGLDHVPASQVTSLVESSRRCSSSIQAHQAQGHPGGVDGGLEGPQHIGQGPDVVLVAVGEEMPRILSLCLMR